MANPSTGPTDERQWLQGNKGIGRATAYAYGYQISYLLRENRYPQSERLWHAGIRLLATA
jgi:hypothetical protein